MTDPSIPAEPMPFRVLLDEAMKQTRSHFGAIYLAVAIPLAIIAVILVAAQARFTTTFAGRAATPAVTFQGCFGFLAAILVTLLVQGLTYSVLTAACVDGVSRRPIDMKAKWAFILQPATLGTLFLGFLAVAAGLICLVLPGLYIGFMLTFLIPVMAVEGLRGGAVLGRSWRLMRYNPHKRFLDSTGSKVFLLFLVGGLIAYAVSFLVQLPFTAIQGYRMARIISAGQAADPRAFLGQMMWIQVPTTILSSLVTTAVGVYTSFGVALLYFDVVRRKEGGDLASAIDARFSGATPPAPVPPA